ncbi:MAG: cellulose synthase subunit BcsC [Bacteroidetes bacterium ADurb.Bin416]|nr:MAG: cellulose synthase subunit BcsC [Bacteroidetes bacterium ADurb.Bin416]
MQHCTSLSQLVRPLFVATVFAMAFSAHAAPIQANGRAIAGAQAANESAQGREHRAGIQALLDGSLSMAKKHFEASLKIDPHYAPALIGLASVAQSESKPAEAEQYLQRAERAAPQSPAVHLAWGRYYKSNKQADRAELSLLEARRVDPKAIPPLLELGDLYLRVGRAADALKLYRDAVFMDNSNQFAQYGLGVAAAANGQRDEALGACEPLLRTIVQKIHQEGLFEELNIIKPFSVLMVDEEMEVLAELLTIDEEQLLLSDDFFKHMDEELEVFYKRLMSDTND